MESFTPDLPEPPVPIPFGQLTVAVAESIQTPHPIAIPNPVLLSDFPDTPQGAVAYTALQRVQEILSHGFYTPSNLSAPHRELWLSTVSQILVHIHNSIRRTHVADPLPNAFANLSPEETDSFKLLATTVSSLSSFFDNRFDNLIKSMDPDDATVDSWEICLRCLEECQYPINKAGYESVLMSCQQNIHAAHRTIINQKLRDLTNEMDAWVDARRTQITDAFLEAVTSEDFSSLYDSVDRDPRLVDWANRTIANFTDISKRYMADEVMDNTVEPIIIERLDAARAKAITSAAEHLATLTRDERKKAEESAIADANAFYESTLATLKAEALEKAEREVAEYKSNLKVAAEERKSALLTTYQSRTPSVPVSSSSIAARASKRKARLEHASNPVSCPSPSRSVSRSRSRSRAPSPESGVFTGRSPDQKTPRASPITELPPTRALTEPALEPSQSSASFGSPSASFKAAMMQVDTTVIPTFEYPAVGLLEPPPTNVTQTNPPAILEPPPTNITQTNPPESSSTDPATQDVMALLMSMSSSLSSITSRLDKLEQPKSYTPSQPAALWAPNRNSAPYPDYSNSQPIECDPAYWEYKAGSSGPLGSDPPSNPADPNWPDRFITSLYFSHLRISSDDELLGSQREFADALPGLYLVYLQRYHFPPTYQISQFQLPEFLTFASEYQQIVSDGRDPQVTTLLFDAMPDNSGPEKPEPSNPNKPGSIRLFPPRPPSAPPITTLNLPSTTVRPAAAGSVSKDMSEIPRVLPSGRPAGSPGAAVTTVRTEVAGTTIHAPQPSKPPPTAPWSIMGKGNKPLSFAAAAAAPRRAAPVATAPLHPIDLTNAQLQVMTRDQLLLAYETRFGTKVTSRDASKQSLINAYKGLRAQQAALRAFSAAAAPPKPATSKPNPPKPRPVSTTEFTITRDPTAAAISGPHGDAASIVRSLQTSLLQAFPGVTPPFKLLGGRWSSALSSNFVLTFAGNPDNDDIKRYSAILCRPFGPGSTILPQRGYTRISINFVPILLDERGDRPSTDTLFSEIMSNAAFNGVVCVSPPKWLRLSFADGQTHSSVVLAILDPDGSILPRITKNPVYMFGATCEAKLFNSLPLIRQCDTCHRLGHSTQRCRLPKGVVICALCGGRHASNLHGALCKTRSNHTNMDCNCPPSCINCRSAKLPSAGHIARDLTCPLRKKYRRQTNQTGASSEEELDRDMVIDAPIPSTHIPSSQPTDDETVVQRPPRVDDSPRPAPTTTSGVQASADLQKWSAATVEDFRTLTLTEIETWPSWHPAHMRAFQLGINIDTLIADLTNA